MKKCKICGQEINLTVSGMPEDICWGCLQKKEKTEVITENTENLIKDLSSLETNCFVRKFKIPVDEVSSEEAEKSMKEFMSKFKNDIDYFISANNETFDEECQSNIKWFKNKKDEALERFNNSISSGDSEEIIFSKLNNLMKFQKYLRLLEDAQIVYKLTKSVKNESSIN